MSPHNDPHSPFSRLLNYFSVPRSARLKPIPHPDQSVNELLLGQEESLRRAAVLVPVTRPVPHRESQLVLTVRSENLRSHAGQISFPGGSAEAQDADLVATALRETEEEIGVDRDAVEVLGLLGHMALPSGFIITPVVGLLDPEQAFEACPREVADIFSVPLGLVMDPRAYRSTSVSYDEEDRRVLELYYEDYRIWGATAAMLFHLACEISVQEDWRET